MESINADKDSAVSALEECKEELEKMHVMYSLYSVINRICDMEERNIKEAVTCVLPDDEHALSDIRSFESQKSAFEGVYYRYVNVCTKFSISYSDPLTTI